MKQKKVGREQTRREKEREREKKRETEHCCKRVLVWVNSLTVGKVIYEGQKKDNPGPYQDDNKAYPKNF
jgi:hypothetical protein